MKFLQVLLFSSVLLSASCFAADQAQQELRGVELHTAKGVTCQQCHGDDPMKNDLPTEKQCVVCHEKGALIAKTKDMKPTNPQHDAIHNGECTGCHRQHEAAVDYCAECHIYNFKVK